MLGVHGPSHDIIEMVDPSTKALYDTGNSGDSADNDNMSTITLQPEDMDQILCHFMKILCIKKADDDEVQQLEFAGTSDQTTPIAVKKDILKTHTRTIVPPLDVDYEMPGDKLLNREGDVTVTYIINSN